jgi:hypothetical protein
MGVQVGHNNHVIYTGNHKHSMQVPLEVRLKGAEGRTEKLCCIKECGPVSIGDGKPMNHMSITAIWTYLEAGLE